MWSPGGANSETTKTPSTKQQGAEKRQKSQAPKPRHRRISNKTMSKTEDAEDNGLRADVQNEKCPLLTSGGYKTKDDGVLHGSVEKNFGK